MAIRNSCAVAGIAAVVACSGEPADSTPVALYEPDTPVWEFPDTAMFQVGSDGDEAYQLDRVRGTLRLPDGRVVVLDGGSSELRFYDGDGRHLMSTGRRGAGPGEFELPWSLYRRGDTLFVTDTRMERLSLFTLDGEFLRTEPGDLHAGAGNVYLHDASIVTGPTDGANYEDVNALIQRLPRPDVYIREVRVAGPGSLWLRTEPSGSEWDLFDDEANAVRRVRIPENFTVHEVAPNYVLGVWEDSLEVQSVRAFALPDPATPAASRTVPPNRALAGGAGGAAASEESVDVAALTEILERLQLYQEHYYSRRDGGYVYAESMEELAAFTPPPQAGLEPLDVPAGTIVRITQGGSLGWFGVAADTASGAACAVGAGFAVPTGWTTGALACF